MDRCGGILHLESLCSFSISNGVPVRYKSKNSAFCIFYVQIREIIKKFKVVSKVNEKNTSSNIWQEVEITEY